MPALYEFGKIADAIEGIERSIVNRTTTVAKYNLDFSKEADEQVKAARLMEAAARDLLVDLILRNSADVQAVLRREEIERQRVAGI